MTPLLPSNLQKILQSEVHVKQVWSVSSVQTPDEWPNHQNYAVHPAQSMTISTFTNTSGLICESCLPDRWWWSYFELDVLVLMMVRSLIECVFTRCISVICPDKFCSHRLALVAMIMFWAGCTHFGGQVTHWVSAHKVSICFLPHMHFRLPMPR